MQVLDPQNCTVNSYQHIIMCQHIRTGFPAIWLAKKWLSNIKRFTFYCSKQIICPTSDRVVLEKTFVFLHFQTLVNQTKASWTSKITYLVIRWVSYEVPFYVSLWKWWCHIINSLLTRLLARSILGSTWPSQAWAIRKMGHCISLYGVSNPISKL